jgi:hypothetical protein
VSAASAANRAETMNRREAIDTSVPSTRKTKNDDSIPERARER